MVDSMGRYLTQSLFLEFQYNTDALFTLKDYDFLHNGRLHVSAKRLYLLLEDPTEYEFANAVFCGWKHWQKCCANKAIAKHIDEWRQELEYKLRSRGVKTMIQLGSAGQYQATKWLADRGWDERKAGRPSKEEKEKQAAIAERIENEFGADILRFK